jgi:Cytochrome P460
MACYVRSFLGEERAAMNRKSMLTIGMFTVWLAVLGLAISAQDKYAVQVPGGLAMSEFKGYEEWQAISMSRNEQVVAVTLGNPVMIDAYKAGIPANGQPVPDGARMAKIHWIPKPNEYFKEATVPGNLLNVDFMVKDSKRFADSGGWGWAVFDYDAATDSFKPGTKEGTPPQGNDAKCGYACHTRVKARDYVFTEYGKR